MVMNVGKRPSFADGDGVSIVSPEQMMRACCCVSHPGPSFPSALYAQEAHIIKEYSQDFYGEQVEIEIKRFLRPEMAFASLQELQLRIQSDIETAKMLTSQTID